MTDHPTPPALLQLGRAIREARKAKGMTQTDLARAVGTGQSNIALIESGERNPSVLLYLRICSALGWPLPYQP